MAPKVTVGLRSQGHFRRHWPYIIPTSDKNQLSKNPSRDVETGNGLGHETSALISKISSVLTAASNRPCQFIATRRDASRRKEAPAV